MESLNNKVIIEWYQIWWVTSGLRNCLELNKMLNFLKHIWYVAPQSSLVSQYTEYEWNSKGGKLFLNNVNISSGLGVKIFGWDEAVDDLATKNIVLPLTIVEKAWSECCGSVYQMTPKCCNEVSQSEERSLINVILSLIVSFPPRHLQRTGQVRPLAGSDRL